MTKRRAALTFENALTKVAGLLGWDEVARICGQAPRTVRNWSEPDTTASITLQACLDLDVAWHAAGGDGAPFLDCYATRLQVESYQAVPGREALIASAARAAKESGEAVSATLIAAHPGARPIDFAIAEQEIEETILALHGQLAALRARQRSAIEGESDEPPANAGARQPELEGSR